MHTYNNFFNNKMKAKTSFTVVKIIIVIITEYLGIT